MARLVSRERFSSALAVACAVRFDGGVVPFPSLRKRLVQIVIWDLCIARLGKPRRPQAHSRGGCRFCAGRERSEYVHFQGFVLRAGSGRVFAAKSRASESRVTQAQACCFAQASRRSCPRAKAVQRKRHSLVGLFCVCGFVHLLSHLRGQALANCLAPWLLFLRNSAVPRTVGCVHDLGRPWWIEAKDIG